MTTPVSDERLGLIASGIADRLAAGASGAPDLERDIASAITELLSLRAIPPGGVKVKGLVDYLWQELCELPDRSSPEEYPDMALVTQAELTAIVETYFEPLSAIEQEQEPPEWRNLALQFDGHRIEALNMLRFAVRRIEEYATVRDILREPLATLKEFLSKPPLDGEAVLANRIKGLSLLSPSVCEGKVTEEMVERAMTRFYDDAPSVIHPITEDELDAYNRVFENMRKALTAALSQEGE